MRIGTTTKVPVEKSGLESDDDHEPPRSVISRDDSSDSDVSLCEDDGYLGVGGWLDNPFMTPPASPAVDKSHHNATQEEQEEERRSKLCFEDTSMEFMEIDVDEEDQDKARKRKSRSKLMQVLGVEAGGAFDAMQL